MSAFITHALNDPNVLRRVTVYRSGRRALRLLSGARTASALFAVQLASLPPCSDFDAANGTAAPGSISPGEVEALARDLPVYEGMLSLVENGLESYLPSRPAIAPAGANVEQYARRLRDQLRRTRDAIDALVRAIDHADPAQVPDEIAAVRHGDLHAIRWNVDTGLGMVAAVIA